MSEDPNADFRIIATADDAILAKHATAQAKYYRDPFAEAFAHAASLQPRNQRRHFQPLIKRGTHARVCCMDKAITAFMKEHSSSSLAKHCQVVVLGAGKDTSFFRYFTKSLMGMEDMIPKLRSGSTSKPPTIHWYEVDHASVVHEKVKIIRHSKMLSQCCPELEPNTMGGFSCTSSKYHLVAADLRDSPEELLASMKLNPSRPTLFVLECVFMYMPKDATQALLSSLAAAAQDASIAIYEPILGSDSFGEVMQRNLVQAKVASDDCNLLQTRTLAEQFDQLRQAGFVNGIGSDMWTAYETVVSPEQRQQANRAEFLDELEEWMLIMRHYCFVVASTTSSPLTSLVDNVSPLGFRQGRCQVESA